MKESEKKPIPPYVSFKTFQNFLDGLKVGVPSRIDRSVMATLSGTIQSQLTVALKYLHLISENGIPTERLTKLVKSEGPEREQAKKDIVITSYSFLFKEGIKLESITLNHMQELFNTAGASGGTTQKCIAFFMALAKSANIKLSPHIKIKPRIGRPKGSKATPAKKKLKNNIPEESTRQSQVEYVPMQQLLLAKFPSFDPSWEPEVQEKWFDGFNKLMEQVKGQKQTDEEQENNDETEILI